MATKSTTAEQHRLLHQHWPGDCCLCKAEAQITQPILGYYPVVSKREWFAGMAMQALIIADTEDKLTFEAVAGRANAAADAMLKEVTDG